MENKNAFIALVGKTLKENPYDDNKDNLSFIDYANGIIDYFVSLYKPTEYNRDELLLIIGNEYRILAIATTLRRRHSNPEQKRVDEIFSAHLYSEDKSKTLMIR